MTPKNICVLVPPEIPVVDLAAFAARHGCELVTVTDHIVKLRWRDSRGQTNSHIYRFPWREKQSMHGDLPTEPGPEAA
jgi:hypothetical protein